MGNDVDEHRDQTPPGRWTVMIPLVIAILNGSLAVSMINTGLPRIASDLRMGAASGAWLVGIYPLSLAVCIVAAARLGDRFGRKTMLMTGLAGSAAVNVLAAWAPSTLVLVSARAILGAAGALVLANVVATIGTQYRGTALTVANGVWMATFGTANAVGPALGGAITEHLGWRWIFLATVPLAMTGCALTAWLVPHSRAAVAPRWDVLSVITSAIALGGLVYGIQRSAAHPIQGLLVAVSGMIVLGVFIVRQRRLTEPLIDVGLFGRRDFSVAFTRIFVSSANSSACIYLTSLHLQRVLGLGPTEAGLRLLPQALAIALGGLSSPLITRVLPRSAATVAALGVQAVGLLLTAHTPTMVAGLALVGVGAGAVGTLATSTLFEATPRDASSQVGAIQEVAFAIGSGMGITVLDTIANLSDANGYAIALTVAAVSAVAVAALPTRRRGPGSAAAHAGGA